MTEKWIHMEFSHFGFYPPTLRLALWQNEFAVRSRGVNGALSCAAIISQCRITTNDQFNSSWWCLQQITLAYITRNNSPPLVRGQGENACLLQPARHAAESFLLSQMPNQ